MCYKLYKPKQDDNDVETMLSDVIMFMVAMCVRLIRSQKLKTNITIKLHRPRECWCVYSNNFWLCNVEI